MSIYDYDYRFDRKNCFETFSASLGHIFIRQVRFNQLIAKDKSFDVDLKNGTLTFDGGQTFDIQIIGKEDSSKNIWQWGFQSFDNFNKDLLQLAYQIQEFGRKFGNEAMKEPCFNLNEMYNGNFLSVIACAVMPQNYCYVKCDHPTGALFVAITDLPESIFESVDVKEFMDITLDRIGNLPVNQKVFVESFLTINETPYVWENPKRLVADFDLNLLEVDFMTKDGFLNISRIRSESCKIVRLSTIDATTSFSIEPSAFKVTASDKLSYGRKHLVTISSS